MEAVLPAFTQNDPSVNGAYQAVLALTGLGNVRTACWEMHHKDGGVYSATFLEFKEPPADLQGSICKPLTEQELRMLPRDVHWAVASRIDVARMYSSLFGLLGTIDETAESDFRQFLSETEEELGFSIEHDLIDQIGDTVLAYDANDNGGMLFTGINVAIKVKDADKFSSMVVRSVKALGAVVSQEAGKDVSVRLSSEDYQGHTIHYLYVVGAPIPFAPAWVSHGEWVVFALYPQMIQNALDRLTDDNAARDSMLANPDFKTYQRRIGDMGYSFTYINTPEGVQNLYSLALPLVQAGVSWFRAFGVPIDPASFPTRRAFTHHLFADLSTSRCESGGLLHVSHGPLPFPVVGGDASSSTFFVATLVSVLIPSLSRARELSKRLVSASNLKGIGMACHIYAIDHNGQFPPNFETILKDESIDPAIMHAPNHEPGKPCYIYVPGQNSNSPADNVLAYERSGLNNDEGANVLFVDGHVQFLKMPELQRVLQKTNARLGRKN